MLRWKNIYRLLDDASGDDEVEECAAQICKIGEIDSDEVTWVECDACDEWYHAFL